MLTADQTASHTLIDYALEQLLKQIRLLEASVPVLGKRRVMGNLLVEAQAGEPAPSPVHAQLLHQLPLAADAVQVPQQQNPQQHFRINRGSPGVAVGVVQLFVDEVETDVTIDEAQQMVFGDLIFNAEVVKQRLRAGVLTHHAAQASENGD